MISLPNLLDHFRILYKGDRDLAQHFYKRQKTNLILHVAKILFQQEKHTLDYFPKENSNSQTLIKILLDKPFSVRALPDYNDVDLKLMIEAEFKLNAKGRLEKANIDSEKWLEEIES